MTETNGHTVTRSGKAQRRLEPPVTLEDWQGVAYRLSEKVQRLQNLLYVLRDRSNDPLVTQLINDVLHR